MWRVNGKFFAFDSVEQMNEASSTPGCQLFDYMHPIPDSIQLSDLIVNSNRHRQPLRMLEGDCLDWNTIDGIIENMIAELEPFRNKYIQIHHPYNIELIAFDPYELTSNSHVRDLI